MAWRSSRLDRNSIWPIRVPSIPSYSLQTRLSPDLARRGIVTPALGRAFRVTFKRFGASYLDTADGTLWGNAILPVLFKEDPRYFRKGHGSFKRRFLYSASTTVWCLRDNGKWGPSYANVLGNFISGGISNAYYPAAERGLEQTLDGAITVTAEGAIGAEFIEFWPDISRHLFKRHAAAQP
jgi:hypothetical protein